MKNKNEKGFALVLSLILLLVMSLMGGALIVISAGDHSANNQSDDYQQTFYVAETALLEGERFVLNMYMGPYKTDGTRDLANRSMPSNQTTAFNGTMRLGNYETSGSNASFTVNYSATNSETYSFVDNGNICFNSFPEINRTDFKVIEDKSNPEQSTIHEFQPNEIFKASDVMVDALTKLLDSERNKRKAS